MSNRVCELLEIEHPILQGGMTWVSDAGLAAAVSNGGGLGIIGAGAMPAELLREEVRKARELTNRPFGVNLIMINPELEQQVSVLLAEKPPVVTLGAVTSTSIIPKLKEAGSKVLPVVAAVAMARRAAQQGADAIIEPSLTLPSHMASRSLPSPRFSISSAVHLPER